jgi:hypothetical protein
MGVACLDLGPVPKGRLGSPFLAVGGLDSTVRILSLDPTSMLTQRATLQVCARVVMGVMMMMMMKALDDCGGAALMVTTMLSMMTRRLMTMMAMLMMYHGAPASDVL